MKISEATSLYRVQLETRPVPTGSTRKSSRPVPDEDGMLRGTLGTGGLRAHERYAPTTVVGGVIATNR